jgi:hypothetical protein
MSHEPTQVPVNRAEYVKFCYLIKVLDALDRADQRAEDDIHYFRSTEGVKSDRHFDWNIVVRHCSPQLLISFLRGAERYEDERDFRMFPHAVIVPRNAFVVFLDSAFELALEEDDTDNSVTSAGDAIRTLQSLAQRLEGDAAVNASRMLTRIEKMLKVKL